MLALRHRLQRALLASLLLSQGTPMLLAGDEIGHSQRGQQQRLLPGQRHHPPRLACRRCRAAGLHPAPAGLLRRRHPALRQACWLTGPSETGAAPTVRWLEPDGGPLRHRLVADHGALAIWLDAAPTTRPGRHGAIRAVLLLINRDPALPLHASPPAPGRQLRQRPARTASSPTPAPAASRQHRLPRADPARAGG